MIRPTATDLLRTIDATLTEKVEPSLSDLTGRSALATVRHLLNFVRIRIEQEGQQLVDDILALRSLLAQVAQYCRSVNEGDAAAAIDRALAEADPPDPARYRSLDDLAIEAGSLREALYQALAQLQSLRPRHGDNPDYQAVRAAIRGYITHQIEMEGEMVAPAFFGRGPRR